MQRISPNFTVRKNKNEPWDLRDEDKSKNKTWLAIMTGSLSFTDMYIPLETVQGTTSAFSRPIEGIAFVNLDPELASELPSSKVLDRMISDLSNSDVKELASGALHAMRKACIDKDLSPVANFLLDWEATAELLADKEGQSNLGSAGEETKNSGISWEETLKELKS
ncbi:hypothetical protein HYR54_02250 [Candidatus Acetothermia bacterium]|nr:hypothetical protein [Candidatus Acetothermia bacterium]